MEHLPIDKLQARATPANDVLLFQNPLYRLLRSYLIACEVEGKTEATLSVYSNTARYFINYLNQNQLPTEPEKITTDDVRLFLLASKNRGLSPATVNQYYRTLRTFFGWLVTNGYLKRSPMENIKPPKIPSEIIKPFSRKDIDNLLLLTSGKRFRDLRDRALILVLLDTGLRLGEVAGIHLTDIDIDKGTIRVMGKGSKERIVPFGRVAKRAILNYVLARSDEYDCLWVSKSYQPMTRRGLQVQIRRLCIRAEISGPKCGAHTFRHTAALAFLRNGAGEFNLQGLLGHTTLEMTRRYVSSLNAEDVIKAHRKASPVDNLTNV